MYVRLQRINRLFITAFFSIILAAILLCFFRIKTQKSIIINSSIDQIALPLHDKKSKLSYKNVDRSLVENISTFNIYENWKGSGYFDNQIFFQYPSSLQISGADNKKIVVEKEVATNLANFNNFYLTLNLITDNSDIESSALIFIDSHFRISKFIIPKLRNGWQILSFPKSKFTIMDGFDWNTIIVIKFEVLPRPLAKVVVNLGDLRAQAYSTIDKDWWFADDNISLLLDKRNNDINLLVVNKLEQTGLTSMVTTIKKITIASDFDYQASYSPLSKTWSGLFFRGNYQNGNGYYFMVDGIFGKQWEIYKINNTGLTILKQDTIPNFQLLPDEWYV